VNTLHKGDNVIIIIIIIIIINMPSTTHPEEEEIVDVPENDGNASMPEQVKRPNPWRKMMMMTNNFSLKTEA
jgi:hypothetical protein